MGWAIATTVVTFLLTYVGAIPGVVSILRAAKVNRLWTMQRYDDAHRAASSAKKWIMVSWAVTAIVIVVAATLVIVLPQSPVHRAIFHETTSGSTGGGGSSGGGGLGHSTSYEDGVASARNGAVRSEIEMASGPWQQTTQQLQAFCSSASILEDSPSDFNQGCMDYLEGKVG